MQPAENHSVDPSGVAYRRAMPKGKALKVAAAIVGSFAMLAGAIVGLLAMDIIGFTVAKLLLATLLGMYVGFGGLIAAYLLVNKLD